MEFGGREHPSQVPTTWNLKCEPREVFFTRLGGIGIPIVPLNSEEVRAAFEKDLAPCGGDSEGSLKIVPFLTINPFLGGKKLCGTTLKKDFRIQTTKNGCGNTILLNSIKINVRKLQKNKT